MRKLSALLLLFSIFSIITSCNKPKTFELVSFTVTSFGTGKTSGAPSSNKTEQSQGCSPSGVQYPSGVLTPIPSTQYISGTVAGTYALFNVSVGESYTFSTCSYDGGSASYDSQLTLFNNSGLTEITSSDDACGDDATITWTSTISGVVRLQLNVYNCSTNSVSTTIAYRGGNGQTSSSYYTAYFTKPFSTSESYSTYVLEEFSTITDIQLISYPDGYNYSGPSPDGDYYSELSYSIVLVGNGGYYEVFNFDAEPNEGSTNVTLTGSTGGTAVLNLTWK